MAKPVSFSKEHVGMQKGIIAVKDILDPTMLTFDVRMVSPGVPNSVSGIPQIEPMAMHSIEHVMAESVREEMGVCCVYVGPMGCMTGLYVVTRRVTEDEGKNLIIRAIINAIDKIKRGDYIKPTKHNCGNHSYHDFTAAKAYLEDYLVSLINE